MCCTQLNWEDTVLALDTLYSVRGNDDILCTQSWWCFYSIVWCKIIIWCSSHPSKFPLLEDCWVVFWGHTLFWGEYWRVKRVSEVHAGKYRVTSDVTKNKREKQLYKIEKKHQRKSGAKRRLVYIQEGEARKVNFRGYYLILSKLNGKINENFLKFWLWQNYRWSWLSTVSWNVYFSQEALNIHMFLISSISIFFLPHSLLNYFCLLHKIFPFKSAKYLKQFSLFFNISISMMEN